MAVFETWLRSDLKQPIKVKQLTGNIFSGDNSGNLIGVEVYDNGAAASLSGDVIGYIIRADGATVMVNGTLSGNRASIVLPQSAYTVVGQASIVIKVDAVTVCACVAFVYRTTTDTLVDPGHIVPSLDELLEKIAACEAATSDANDAATLANTKAGIANDAAALANTKAALADEKATLANTKAGLADEKASLANTKAALAEEKATAANNAATAANAAAGKINDMVVAISAGDPTAAPTVTLTVVDGHFVLAFSNMKGVQGDTGEAFHIVKTYASISEMNADYSGTDVHIGEYVMIVSNVEDPDNAKVYIKGSEAYAFVVDMSGSAGIQGQQAYVWIRYADAQPTQDSDMITTPSNWIGIYSGTASSAPTTYSSYTWFEFKGAKGDTGATGTAAHVYIRYAAAEPTQDSDMKTTPDAWMGIYSGDAASAPTTYTSYTWYQIKGATGSTGATGQDGTSAYVHIRYAAQMPTQDSDMKTTVDAWIGIYSGTSSTAPTTYTSYTWYRFKGETGSAANVYATTVPMSENDSTKVSEAIAAKLDADQGITNAGKFLRVGSGGAVAYDYPYERYASATGNSGFPATGDEHKLYIAMDTGLIYVWDSTELDYVMVGGSGSGDENIAAEYDNTVTYAQDALCFHEDALFRAKQAITTAENWTSAHWEATTVAAELLRRKKTQTAVTDPTASGTAVEFISGITQDTEGVIVPSKKTVRTMTGAGSSAAGTSGLVPAPAAGDNEKFLKGDGTWGAHGTLRQIPFSIGANSWTLSNGVYSYTYASAYVTATSVEWVEVDDSFRTAIRGDFNAVKATGGGGVVFTTDQAPAGTLTGEIRCLDNDDGKLTIVTEMTALPTLRDVPFTLLTTDWTLSNGVYTATFDTAYITTTSHDFLEYDENIENANDAIKAVKKTGGGGMTFTTRRLPSGTITGTILPLDNADGKVAVALQETVMPIANGGTGENTLAGAKSALGISSLESSVSTLSDHLAHLIYGVTDSISIGANTTITTQIDFPTGLFTETPVFVANVLGLLTPVTEITGPNIIELTSTYAKVRVRSSYNSSLNYKITWIAYGA